jgi:hypothetical protein
VLPIYEGVPVLEMKEHMVKLSFPERLTFNFLMSEAKKNVKLFMSQNLCVFPENKDSKIKVQFTLDALQAAVRSPMYFDRSNQNLELVGTYTGFDTAWSVAATADYSALVTIKVFKERSGNGRFIMGVTDIRLVQMRINELAIEAVDCFKANKPDRVLAERSGAWQSLAVAIQNEMHNRQLFPIPDIYWKQTAFGSSTGSKNKTIRIKGLEAPLATGQLLFMQHPLLDQFFDQMVKFTGAKSSTSRHDDGPDALSLVAEMYFFPLFGGHVIRANPEETELEQAAALQQTLDAHYSRVFGSRRGDTPQATVSEQPPEPHPLWDHLAKFGMARR